MNGQLGAFGEDGEDPSSGRLVDVAACMNEQVVSGETDRSPCDHESSFAMFLRQRADALEPSVGLWQRLARQYENTDLWTEGEIGMCPISDIMSLRCLSQPAGAVPSVEYVTCRWPC